MYMYMKTYMSTYALKYIYFLFKTNFNLICTKVIETTYSYRDESIKTRETPLSKMTNRYICA